MSRVDLLAHLHPVEFELQVVGLEAAETVFEVHLDLVQRVEGADELLVDPVAEQQPDVVEGGGERLLRHDLLEQFLELERCEPLAAEDALHGPRVLRADLEVIVQQEQPIGHGAEDILGLLARPLDVRIRFPQVANEVENNDEEQHQRQRDAADLHPAQALGASHRLHIEVLGE